MDMHRCGIILAGGASRRMGTNKAFLKIGGVSFIENALALIETYNEKYIVANDVDLYKHLDIGVLKDVYENKGPVCGLYTGLLAMKSEKAYVTSVDTPYITPQVVDLLWDISESHDCDCVIPLVSGKRQVLNAIYNKSALKAFTLALEKGEWRLQNVVNTLKVKEVDMSQLERVCNPNEIFRNLNTPLDLQGIRD